MLVFQPDNLTMSSKFAVKLWCGTLLAATGNARLTLIKWVDIFAYNGQPSPQEHIDQIPSSLG